MNILALDYEYPADTAARERLSSLVELREFSRDFLARVAEPWIAGELAANGVKVTERQLPWLHKVVVEVAGSLGVPVPHVYLRQDTLPNAYTHGVGSQTFLALTSQLIEQLSGPELQFVVGHEMGHIKSQHVLYTTMSSYLLAEAERRNEGFSPLLQDLMQWQREAEITADRAGLLVCGDVRSACVALLTLTIGSRKIAAQLDAREFAEDQDLSIEFNPIAMRMERGCSHPFMPRRVKELLAFADSASCQRVLQSARSAAPDEGEPDIEIELIN